MERNSTELYQEYSANRGEVLFFKSSDAEKYKIGEGPTFRVNFTLKERTGTLLFVGRMFEGEPSFSAPRGILYALEQKHVDLHCSKTEKFRFSLV